MEEGQLEEILIDFSKTIYRGSNENEILKDLAKNCISTLGFKDCTIYTLDEENTVLIQHASFSLKDQKLIENSKTFPLKLGVGISGFVAASGIAEIILDDTKDSRGLKDCGISIISIPIKINDDVLGVIECRHSSTNYFTNQHVRILSAIASICAIKLQAIRADKKIMEEQQKLFSAKEEMVHLKLKASRSQMNPHFIFNALNGIQHFITTGNKKLSLEYLSAFSKLIRFHLGHIEKETVDLTNELEMLQGYLKLQKLRYGEQFKYRIVIDEKSKGLNAKIPSFLMQTVFENIIEHAIFNRYQNYKIDIVIKANSQKVSTAIKFNYALNDDDEVKYIPKYRERLMKWQDQIRLLNHLHNYQIEKKVTFYKNSKSNGGKIAIVLPNLN